MVKLPDRTALGGLPSLRSGRAIANFDVTAVGRGQEAFGRSVQNVGNQLYARSQEEKKKDTALGLAKAEAYKTENFLGTQNTFAGDPNFNTYESRASQALSKTISEASEFIPDKHVRELWATRAQTDASRVKDSILDRGFKLQRQTEIIGLDESLEVHRRIYVDPDTTDEQKDRARQDIEDTISLASETGLLTPEMDEQFRQKFLDDADYNRGLLAIENDPAVLTGTKLTFSPQVNDAIQRAAKRHGVSEDALRVIALIESRGNPGAANPASSAGGLFQQIDANAKTYNIKDRFDAYQSADGAARFMRDNIAALQKALGRAPTIGELYLAHQQGAEGARKLLANPNHRAVDIVGSAAVKKNGGHPDMTAQEFANLWIGKAERISGRQITVPGWFERLSPEDQAKLEDTARRAQEDQIVRQQQEFKDRYTKIKDAYELNIEMGNIANENVIFEDPILTDGDKADLINDFRKKTGDRRDAQKLLAAAAIGNASINSFDSDQTKVAENAHDYIDKIMEGDNAESAHNELIASTGYIPKNKIAGLRNGVMATDPAEMAEALMMAGRMQQVASRHFDVFEGGQEVRKRLTKFRHLVNERGATPEEAAKYIADMADPEKRKQREALLETKMVKDKLKNIKPSEVASIFKEDFWSPDFPTEMAGAAITAEAREILADAIVEAAGDMDLAETILSEELKKKYGVSDMTLAGSDVISRYPPEVVLPPDSQGSHEWIMEQLALEMEAEGIAVGEGGAFLNPREDTSPQNPVYDVFYYDETGRMVNLPGEFRPDVQNREISVERAIEKAAEDFETRIENMEHREREVDAILNRPELPDWMKARQIDRSFELERMRNDSPKEDDQEDNNRARPHFILPDNMMDSP